MTNRMKYIGLIGLIPILVLVFTTGYFGSADAVNTGTVENTNSPAHQYGSATNNVVCGDHLCSEGPGTTAKVTTVKQDETPSHFPTIETIEAFQFDQEGAPHAYIVVLKVTAGDQNLENIHLVVDSDVDSSPTMISSLFAHDDTNIVYRVHALDPTTITARITSYQLNI